MLTHGWLVAMTLHHAPKVCNTGDVIGTSYAKACSSHTNKGDYFSFSSSFEIRMSCPGENKNLTYETKEIQGPRFVVACETLKSFRALGRSNSNFSRIHRRRCCPYHGIYMRHKNPRQTREWWRMEHIWLYTAQFIPEENHKATLLCSKNKPRK